MTIRYTTDPTEVAWPELATLFARAPLGPPRAPELFERAFDNSALKIFAFDNDTLVGAGRALCDGVWRAVLYDVAVLPEYQGRGIGSAIVRDLIDRAEVPMVMLYAAPGKEPFYEPFGFRKMKTAMAIMKEPAQQQREGYLE